jgi:hypothetical protein
MIFAGGVDAAILFEHAGESFSGASDHGGVGIPQGLNPLVVGAFLRHD